jgi:GWxTD domain-containing protein
MKNTLFTLLLICLPLAARSLDAGVTYVVYATPEKTYVEVSLEIAGSTVATKPLDSLRHEAAVEVLLVVRRGDTIVNYEKYALRGVLTFQAQVLLDVRRLAIPPGTYTLEVTLHDLHDAGNRSVYRTPFEVAIAPGLHLSDLQLLRIMRPDTASNRFTKNGLYQEPLPFRFYDRSARYLYGYAEMYHTAPPTNHYSVRYYVEQEISADSVRLIAGGNQRKKPGQMVPIAVQMDISQLPSGNYRFTVEVRDHLGALLTRRRVAFQRSNPFLNGVDTMSMAAIGQEFVRQLDHAALRYALRAIGPLFRGGDVALLQNALQTDDTTTMRFVLFRHFAAENPNSPEMAYRQYMEVAKVVDKQFHSGFRYGFETDRGRIFLRYGRPDDLIHVEDDPGAPPYEVWVYYDFPKTRQKNVKFLFYNPSLAGDDFIVLHSNARGEVNNQRWERDLYQRNAGEQYSGDNYHDATEMQRNNNRNARIYFEDF